MSSMYAEPLEVLERGLDVLARIDPGYRTAREQQDVLVGLSRFIARAEAERMRVLAVADDIARRPARGRPHTGWPTPPETTSAPYAVCRSWRMRSTSGGPRWVLRWLLAW